MSDKEIKIDEEQVFDYFLEELDGQENQDHLDEIKEDTEAYEALEGFKRVHAQLEKMRYTSLTPGGVPPGKDDSIPEKILDYKVLGKLGEGGMGLVYKAFDASLNRVLAIKVIKAGVNNKENIGRFHQEAQSIAKMSHNGIINIYNYGVAEGIGSYFAMEYLKGGSLRKELDEKGALPPAEVLELAKSLADALSHAHQRGVLHRDIKPDNILWNERMGMVKLTDFGLSKIMTTETNRTMNGQVYGTFSYMSPEQLRGDRLDERSDLYSLGVTLLELLTGERTFREKSPVRLLDMINKNGYVRDLRRQEKWREWDKFLKCLEKSISSAPEDRHVSCADFVASLPGGTKKNDDVSLKNTLSKRHLMIVAVSILLLAWTGSWLVSRGGPSHHPPVQVLVSTSPHDFVQDDIEKRLAIDQAEEAEQKRALQALPMDAGSFQLSVEIVTDSGLHPKIEKSFEYLIMTGNDIGAGYHWRRGETRGEGDIHVRMDTQGAKLLVEMRLTHPNTGAFSHQSSQRIELGLERMADEIKSNIKSFLIKHPYSGVE